MKKIVITLFVICILSLRMPTAAQDIIYSADGINTDVNTNQYARIYGAGSVYTDLNMLYEIQKTTIISFHDGVSLGASDLFPQVSVPSSRLSTDAYNITGFSVWGLIFSNADNLSLNYPGSVQLTNEFFDNVSMPLKVANADQICVSQGAGLCVLDTATAKQDPVNPGIMLVNLTFDANSVPPGTRFDNGTYRGDIDVTVFVQ